MRYYVSSASACADPGIFTKWGGGGGGGRGSDSKKLGQRCFVIFAVFSPHLQLIEQFYRGDRSQGPMVYFLENNIFKGSKVGPTFYGVGGGVQLFSKGGGGRPNANFCRNLSKL